MTNEQINQLREVVESAPEGATGFSECGCYLSRSVMAREELFFGGVNKEWMPVPLPNKFDRRSLEDLKQIIADHDEKQRLRERVTELEAQAPLWISVEDRLPSRLNGYIDDLVLIAVKNKNKPDGIYLIDVCAFDGDSWCERIHTYESITHWMPLPEKPND